MTARQRGRTVSAPNKLQNLDRQNIRGNVRITKAQESESGVQGKAWVNGIRMR